MHGLRGSVKLYDINNAKKCSPVGRLKQSLHKWEQIGASRYILNVIENGYTLPLKTEPQKVCLRNNKSAREMRILSVKKLTICCRKEWYQNVKVNRM